MSDHKPPIVPHVLYIADQRHPWRLPPIERLATKYHTPTTVATGFGTIDVTVKRQPGRKVVTKQQSGVWCLPDDAAWARIAQARAVHQAAFDALANGLRALGSYASRIEKAGGFKKAPNPLSPTVIFADDPDSEPSNGFWYNRSVPYIERKEIASHTPKMLHVVKDGKPWSTSHQRDHFVCPTDADWEHVRQLRQACQDASDAWQALLRELGTYRDAREDGRYAKAPPPAVPRGLVGAAQRIAARQAPAEQETAMQPSAPAPAIKRGAPLTLSTNVALADDTAGGILSSGLQERARRYVAARRRSGEALLEAVAELAAARAEASHGEWGIFLQAIGLDETTAVVQLQIHEAAQADPRVAERLRTGWLNASTARELLSAPPDVQQRVLAQPEPPTTKQIRAEKQAAKPATSQVLDQPPAPKPATCTRCGAERSPTRLLTSYGAGLVPEYPGRAVTLCSTCIPELLAARKAREATPPPPPPAPEPAVIPQLPPALAGWKWQRSERGDSRLMTPDLTWSTKWYTHSTKAIAEALRCVNSQPKATPAPARPDLGPAAAESRRETEAGPAPGPRDRAAQLLTELAPLLRQVRTELAQDLAEAIDALSFSDEGAEREAWLGVGWALLDRYQEWLERIPTLESEGIHVPTD